MTSPDEVVRRHIATLPDNPHPLGRHVVHDPRSRAFRFAVSDPSPVANVLWHVRVGVLDQLDVGSCTGQAGTYRLATDEAGRFGRVDVPQPLGRAPLDQSYAYALYSAATAIDQWAGTWPPDDTGSSGLAVAKVLKQRGLVMMYQHCETLDELLQALTHHAVMFGCNWYESMFWPNERGLVRLSGRVAGGHEFLVVGVDVGPQEVICLQSWGAWGARADGTPRDVDDPGDLGGYFRISFTDMRRLLAEDGDAIVLHVAAENASGPATDAPTRIGSWLGRIVKLVNDVLLRLLRRRR